MITLTGQQIVELAEFAVPDNIGSQLETEITIEWNPGGRTDPETGDKIEAGYYAWFTEYPEEGALKL